MSYFTEHIDRTAQTTRIDSRIGIGGGSATRMVSTLGAFVTFFKSLFGAGLLALPNVLGVVGLPLGAFLYISVALGCSGTCYLLLRARELAANADFENEQEGENGLVISSQKKATKGMTRRDDGICTVAYGSMVPLNEFNVNKEPRKMYPWVPARRRLSTYGDLAEFLLGPTASSVARWTVIVLNILFTAGLYIAVCKNVSSVLRIISGLQNDNYGDDAVASRRAVGLYLSPVVALSFQIPWLQDMAGMSAVGLFVYVVGVMGSTVYSAIFGGLDPPKDIWSLKWEGIPIFLGSAVYSLEGINLALPTVMSMADSSRAVVVVCSAILCYGIVTMAFAVAGYAGGLGGGPGTGRDRDECDVVTSCIEPAWPLRIVVEVALSVALLLTMPVMLYPTTEMLEALLSDRRRHRHHKQVVEEFREGYEDTKNENGSRAVCRREISLSEWNFPSPTSPTDTARATNPSAGKGMLFSTDEHCVVHGHEKIQSLRFFLAIVIVALGCTTESFTLFSGLVGAVGLTFAGFVLPPLLYARAKIMVGERMRPIAWLGLCGFLIFGIGNMVIGGVSSMRELLKKG